MYMLKEERHYDPTKAGNATQYNGYRGEGNMEEL
jgi:hypothetical protein